MKENRLKKRIAYGILLIIIGVFFLLHDWIVEKREQVFSAMNLELSSLLEEESIVQAPVEETPTEPNTPDETETTPTPEPVESPKETTDNGYETYAGILEIPKIGFQKGFYQKNSSLNNVKFNLKILDASSYPDTENGNVIIIGHSGNYSNSYFGNLYQLVVGDTASIQYQNKKYTYKIVNIYTESKDGTVTIYRDETKSCLTLITCTKDDSTTQTVYIFELESVE